MFMQKFHVFLILSMLLPILACAQSPQLLAPPTSVGAMLRAYNISNSTIASLNYTHINYSGGTYLLAYLGQMPSFLINATGSSYTIVLNSTQIAAIIGPAIRQRSISTINATYLSSAMREYDQSSIAPLSDCANETGLSTGATCTLDNNCASCSSVPVCRRVFEATGGIYGGFADGVMQFETEYDNLQNNFSLYFSSVNSLGGSNAQSSLGTTTASFSSISSITNFMYQNPIFPPPPTADYTQCVGYGSSTANVTSSGGPWYCSSLGFCEFLTYNYTLLGNMQAYITHINSLPTSDQQINQIAVNITNNEDTYVLPALSEVKLKQVKQILSTTFSTYNSTVAAASSLLSHISNATISADLAGLQANYSVLTKDYISANLTHLNKSLSVQYAKFEALYEQLNSTYSTALDLASNNTVNLVELQSGNPNPSPQLTSLSFEQAELNSQLGLSIRNLTTLTGELKSVNKQSQSLSNNPSFTQTIARDLGAPFAHAVLAAMGSQYTSSVSLAPALSLIPAIIIGILFIALLFWFHYKLVKSNRISVNSRTSKNWRILYILAGIVVLLFLLASYAIASGANQYAPISAFISSVHSSKSVIIALNGTNNTAMTSCAAKIKASLTAINKTSQTITMSGIACNNGVPLETTDKCLAYYAANNMPVVILTNSSADSISAYSYYGSVLSVSGDEQFMNSCIASTMIR